MTEPNDLMNLKQLYKTTLRHQRKIIDMVASDNEPSRYVREPLSSLLVGVYGEGYPNGLYYADFEDEKRNKLLGLIQATVQKLAQKVFSRDYHVNVQPHSGSEANDATYFALMESGDTFMGMELSQGGHLTHGHKVNFSGKLYNCVKYGVNENGLIDYEEVRKIAKAACPKIIVAGASAYPRVINFEKFSEIAKEVGALLVVDMAHIAGLVAAGAHPSPFGYADVVTTTTHKTLRGPRGALIFCKPELAEAIDKAVFPGKQGGPHYHTIVSIGFALEEALTRRFKLYQKQVVKNAKVLAEELRKYGFDIVSGGTDNHLVLVDLRSKGIAGAEAEELLIRGIRYGGKEYRIRVNKNTIPGDKSPKNPSGIRLGTPVITTRGYKEKDVVKLAEVINMILTKK